MKWSVEDKEKCFQRYCEGVSYKDTAKELNMKVGTVRMAYQNIRFLFTDGKEGLSHVGKTMIDIFKRNQR